MKEKLYSKIRANDETLFDINYCLSLILFLTRQRLPKIMSTTRVTFRK